MSTKTKFYLIGFLAFGLLTLGLYLAKDWLATVIPDDDYSERVTRNKYIAISIIAVIGFTSLHLINRYKRKQK